MRIGIIGAGHIGGTLAQHFVRAGHEVLISNSRGPDMLAGARRERLGAAHRPRPSRTPRASARSSSCRSRLATTASARRLP